MEKYKIIINHTVAYQCPVVVEANDECEAQEKVEELFYGDDDFKKKVLSSIPDFSETQIVFDRIGTTATLTKFLNVKILT